MFIEEIIIDGFKTIGVPTSLGPFVPGINILVGCNGAGKTSIIDAIELIFDEEFDEVQDEKFDELVCHNTLKKSENFINVEIIFNNSNPTDNEFPPKFSMQRMISHGMDSYSLNQNEIYRNEFIQKICNAKIDISVVRQDKVTKFATSSNKERLELFFKMISYSKHPYEEKQQRWNTSVEARNNTMVEVNQCYDKLKEECRICEEFQKLLRKKEWIIYGMKKKKLAEMKRELKQFEEQFGSWIKRQSYEKSKYFKLKSELEMLESELTEEKIGETTMEADLIKNEGEELERNIEVLENKYKKLKEVEKMMDKTEKAIKEKEDVKKQKEVQVIKLKINVLQNDIVRKALEDERDELFKKIEEAQRNIQEFPDEACKNLDPALKDIEKLTEQQLIFLQSTVEEELRYLSHYIDQNASEMFSRMHKAVEAAETTIKSFKNALRKQVYEDLAKINQLFKDIVMKFMSRSQIELVLITENEEYGVDEAKDVVDLDDLIGMSVKFSEFEDLPAQTMNELSGGQKAVIALSFMIAFQKHFAVTVILLDEVDQDLDVSYRHILRKILKEVASKSQVFITTFRPEFLEVGEHFYQVEKAGPTSNISKISKVQALEFLKSVKEG